MSGVMHSAGMALSPGEALRRVMEAVAGGLLMEHGPGLRDPCEKELVVRISIHCVTLYMLHMNIRTQTWAFTLQTK